MTGKRTVSLLLAAILALSGVYASGAIFLKHEQRATHYASEETEETWFSHSETKESFDFGLEEYWIDLNDLEYTVKDNIKSYLFIGTDHSGNEKATDETYQGSMADFLLVAVINKTEKTYGFIQLNLDTITEVVLVDQDGEVYGSAEEQLCTAHWYGGSRQQSCLNTVDVVSDLLGGLTIDGYYSVGMDDIAQLNHVIGGATVTIEDDFSKVDPSLKMGEEITLTDEQAYHYLQGRMAIGGGENESRMRRQRTYMEAVYDKVIDRVKTEKNFLEDITDTLGDSVTTNMNGEDFAEFRDAFREGESLGIQSPEGESVLGRKLDDGLDHMEFYMDEASMADILIEMCGLEIDDLGDWDYLETETEVWEDFT